MNDDAASAVIGFSVAAALLVIGLASIYLASDGLVNEADMNRASSRSLHEEADRFRDAAFGSAGRMIDGSPWTAGADGDDVVQFGLLAPGSNAIERSKFADLLAGNLTADPSNAKVDYDEIRELFGFISAGVNFRLLVSDDSKQPSERILEYGPAHPSGSSVASVTTQGVLDDGTVVRVIVSLSSST